MRRQFINHHKWWYLSCLAICKKNCQYFKKDKGKEAVKLLNSIFGTRAVKNK